ncbi:hypothetical protein F4803DRAFT_513071 [Xylaria telfairii]|nr:hypothetical protein F4803DRAFT_513071 [Xylaria telfairii]
MLLYASHIAASPRVLLLVYPLATKQCKGIGQGKWLATCFPQEIRHPGAPTKMRDADDNHNNEYNDDSISRVSWNVSGPLFNNMHVAGCNHADLTYVHRSSGRGWARTAKDHSARNPSSVTSA